MPRSSPHDPISFGFPVDGRSDHEVKEMKEYGYSEDPEFADKKVLRKDGYFCGSCKFFKYDPFTMPQHPGPHDGICKWWKFRDRDFGCCGSWIKA